MASILHNSTCALAQAIWEEHQRAEENGRHGTIHISWITRLLRNGIAQCSVQIECEAGCGWLVEEQGDHAIELIEKAAIIHKIINSSVQGQMALAKILSSAFPEFIVESDPIGTEKKQVNYVLPIKSI